MTALDLWAALAGESGWFAVRFDGQTFWVDNADPGGFVRKVDAWAYEGDLEVCPVRFREATFSWPWASSCLWVRVETPAGRDALEGFNPTPTLVLAAGARRDALWALSGELTRRWAECLNRRLAHHLGGKLKDAGPWFSFSPAGTVLREGRGRPVAVSVERWDGELHSAKAVAGQLPDPPESNWNGHR